MSRADNRLQALAERDRKITEALDPLLALEVGTRVLNYGSGMSVAVINEYHRLLGGEFVPVLSAWQWWDWKDTDPRISDLYIGADTPQRGAIMVGRNRRFNNDHGHVGIVVHIYPGGRSFEVLHQPTPERGLQLDTFDDGVDILGFLHVRTGVSTK